MRKKRMKPLTFLKKYGRIIIGGLVVLLVIAIALFADQIATHDPELVDMTIAKQRPSAEHLFGTDIFGRDIFSRVVKGSQNTLIVAIGSQLLVVLGGTVVGLFCGYFHKVDMILMRILEGFSCIPSLLMCLLAITIFGPGMIQLILAMGIQAIPGCASLIRVEVLRLREQEFIESERAMGAGTCRVLFKHLLPACTSILITRFTNSLAGAVLSMTGLSFLGVGLDPNIPSWGGIISEGQTLMFAYPHLIIYAAGAICITVMGFSFLGDGLRDLLDPTLN